MQLTKLFKYHFAVLRLFCVLAVLMGTISFSGCARLHKEVLPSKHLTVDNISLSQKTINPSDNEKVNIKYRLNQPAYVTVNIYDSDNHWINTLIQDKYQPAGYNTIIWDGKDSQGKFVPDEAYIYTILAKNPKTKQEFLYDPADSTSGWELEEMQGKFDQETGQISYILPKAARVRLRMGVAKGPLLNNLLHWQPQEAGRHTLFWGGKDNSGKFDFSKHPELRLFFASFSLPDNCIIVQGSQQARESYQITLGVKDRIRKEKPFKLALHQHHHSHHHKEESENPGHDSINQHSHHTQDQCQEPQVQISFPEQTQEQIPLLKGKVPVRITIADKDRARLIRERFGVAIFIDYVFFYEDLDAITPYTYYLDTTHLNPGKHILSVSIESYEDHIRTESMLIEVVEQLNRDT